MMESLPLDTSHPAVREYLSLVRLQVLTPLSLLINIVTVLVCSIVIKPSIGDITKLYPTSISPSPSLIAVYVTLIYIGQIGYCFLLVLARKAETKAALVKGVGLSIVFSNWVMALWAISWVFQYFLVSTILLGILIVLLLYSNISLLTYHPPISARPLDIVLIHAPMRFFLILPLSLMFPYSLFVTLGLTFQPNYPQDYAAHPWPGFGVVFGVNLLGLAIIILRRDIIWAVAATWICASIWNERPKPAPVYVVVILFTVLHPLGLVASFLYHRLHSRQGKIALPPDDQSEQQRTERTGPREMDAEALWG